MPNLVGIGNSQAPTNAMLGGLAYQDSVGEINIDKIKARTSDTAKDIFVYDTSKDSDGGAWRKKATKQSWYDEGVSEIRGARKEFPAVAVIVVKNGVAIYDGDDPNLPLWMEFEVNNSPSHIIFTNPTVVHMLNGVLVVGTNPNATNNDYWDGGIKVFNFISDTVRSYSGTRSMIYDMNISQRNDPAVVHYDTTNVLVSPNVSAVTMFLLPNATIDVNTGLPTPTILVATRRGISVVKENGVVYDMLVTVGGGSNYKTHSIEITKDLKILHNWSDRASDRFSFLSLIPLSLLDSDSSYGYEYQFRNEGTYQYNVGGGVLDMFDSVNTYFEDVVPTELGYFAIGSNNGLVNVQHIPMALNNGGRSTLGDARFSGGMHCRIANDFNTGWLFNNIKGAFLSDTDTTDLTRNNLVTNGTFDSGTGWALLDPAAPTISGGKLVFDGTSGVGLAQQAVSPAVITSGLQYTVKFTVSDYSSGTLYVRVANCSYGPGVTANGGYYQSFVAGSTPTETVLFYGNSFNGKVDDVQVYLEDQDRSCRENGLQIFGTVPRQVVATGAELVSYGPFSTLNRLRQYYNSDLNFGTNDFSIMFWVNHDGTDAHQSIVGRDQREFAIFILDNASYSRTIRVYAHNSGNSTQVFDSTTNPFPMNSWNHVCVNYTGGNTATIYINGVLNNTGALDYDIDNTTYNLNVGCRNDTANSGFAFPAANCKLALLRISKGAPTADQVKKIYNDEKCLFNENAKCTLYGTSDSIKAIDYDESNNITHVGTSAGRSEFVGLNRINNTTTAVTTKISVSDKFIAEQ